MTLRTSCRPVQTVKEETLEILKKLKALKAEKTKLTREFRAHKDRNAALKKELEHSLAEYEVGGAHRGGGVVSRRLTGS